VLATDSTVNTPPRLGVDDWPALARPGPAALARFLARCHEREGHGDPGGQDFPRAKNTHTKRNEQGWLA